MLKQSRATALVLVLAFMGSIGAHAQSGFGYKTSSILNAIRNRHSDLVMIAAHRGLHSILSDTNGICCVYASPTPNNGTMYIDYTHTPENSLQSIYNAAWAGIEVIELDVRLTQDGVPILTHDSTWGRETNVGNNWGQCCFNPWGSLPGLSVPDGDPGSLGGGTSGQGPQEDAGLNPNVNSWSLDSVQRAQGGIQLRTSTSFSWSPWNENPPTLQNALDYIRSNTFPVIISLDIKDNQALQAAWYVVAHNNDFNGVNYYRSVVFKFDTAWNYPYLSNFRYAMSKTAYISGSIYSTDDQFIQTMPVFQTSGIAPNLYGSEANELLAMQEYAAWTPVQGLEVNLKQNPGILTSLYNWGDSSQNQKALANFNPYKESVPSGLDPTYYLNYRFFYSNGYCCAALSEYFYNGAPNNQASDTQDQRPNWDFILANRNGFNFITTDNPLAMGQYLWSRGQRNTSYFY